MNREKTIELLKKNSFKFTKSLGQNFLIDDTVLEDIVISADVNPHDEIIEIGPGFGALTRLLLDKGKSVTAIELDKKLIPILKDEFKDYNNLKIINEDVMKCDMNEIIGDKEVKILANLPYYVTTPIITKLIKGKSNILSITIMIQKEVADRIAASPSTKDYGALTLMVKYYCDVTKVREVPPTSFMPSPKVSSTVIKLVPRKEKSVSVNDEVLFFKVIREAFNMRRKTLSNSLMPMGLSKEELMNVLQESGIDPKRRGETLSIEEFALLSNKISDLKI
ncbi:MAG: 16S rRNA (adenine(1518)-N(6)/adenine(1519)-N(6))-dimethyltransferase RsmA [Bacillota bacterium]|nr:16S rRNA (adenine(1518)-N(6)/adenine(1519)-N(6))-dimethyltransferase RsmA [Bacillota bacterium]